MKYRVKQIGNWFYPQYKWLCFWMDIKEKRIVASGKVELIAASCLTLDNAKSKIAQYKKSLVKKEKIITNIWEIE